jgi:hypothetical protein
MNANDFAFIEFRLDVVLPRAFKVFMGKFPNDRRQRLQNDCGLLPCNGELFVILQLLRFNNDREFDFYELQPETRSRRFMDIGDDGCGNFFCMAGDDSNSNELWMWEHDPYNGFGKCNHWALSDYLGDRWELESQPDPIESTKGVFALRADHPFRSILHPITMQEWLAYIKRHPNIELDETQATTNPFTGETIVARRWPGRARLITGSNSHRITYLHGALSFGSHDFAQLEIEQIAADLDSHVWRGIGT